MCNLCTLIIQSFPNAWSQLWCYNEWNDIKYFLFKLKNMELEEQSVFNKIPIMNLWGIQLHLLTFLLYYPCLCCRSVNRSNTATCLCLSQVRTWTSYAMIFYVQWVEARGDFSLCWSWWNILHWDWYCLVKQIYKYAIVLSWWTTDT
jgi:hypothetical protein